jgi:hypothetical protein
LQSAGTVANVSDDEFSFVFAILLLGDTTPLDLQCRSAGAIMSVFSDNSRSNVAFPLFGGAIPSSFSKGKGGK